MERISDKCRRTLDRALERKDAGQDVWRYFDERIRSPEQARRVLPFSPVPPADASRVLADFLNAGTGQTGRAIYVHIPFCSKICRFCGYNRVLATDEDLVRSYFAALVRQARRVAKTAFAETAPFDALYVGGGTPTAAPAELLAGLISRLGSLFPLSQDCEITVESRIADIDPETVGMLAEAGVGRMSFGVQCFDTHVRRKSGRIEERERVVEAVGQVPKLGVETVCIDLISNLEGQSLRHFRRDLETADSLPVSGLDVYPLVLFERSVLKKEIDENIAEKPGGIEDEYRFFMAAENALQDDWRKVTPVHFSRLGGDRAVYVTARAQNFDVLALGAGAAGNLGNLLYINPADVWDYIAAQDDGGEKAMAFSLPETFGEYRRIFSLSEGRGVSGDDLRGLLGGYGEVAEKLERIGLIASNGDRFASTSAGRFWAGNLSQVLAEVLAERMTGEGSHISPNSNERRTQ